MNAFYEHHRDSMLSQCRCFDRILLNGLIQPFQQLRLEGGASSIAFGLQIAIEAAMVAGSNSNGEVTWQATAP
jgi:hypothetical protein